MDLHAHGESIIETIKVVGLGAASVVAHNYSEIAGNVLVTLSILYLAWKWGITKRRKQRMNKLTNEQIQTLCNEFHLEDKAIKSVVQVECAGSGFDPKTGNIKIQFEPHIFSKYLLKKGISHTINKTYLNIGGVMKQAYLVKVGTKSIENGVQGQLAEYESLLEAEQIDKECALLATSWGLGQIMGFNYKAAGYESAEAMVESFKESEENQLRGMLKFIQSNKPMFTALQEKNWAAFAGFYNGPAYKQFNYDVRLQEAYNKV